MHIRAYRSEDLDAVIELWRDCELLRPWNDPVADIALCVRTSTSELFVAVEADGRVVGAVMAGSDGHRGWMYYLASDPSRRRDGLGAGLVGHAERWLAGQGIGKVQIMIREENAPVRAFYERVGYAVEDRLVMSRRLAPAAS